MNRWPASVTVVSLLLALVAVTTPATDALAAPVPGPAAEPVDRERGPAAEDVAELAAAARRDGSVRAIVGLDVPFEPEGQLTAGQVAGQRGAISDGARALRRGLAGAGVEVVRTFDALPSVVVELPEGAVQALARSPHVASVAVDEVLEPLLADSTEIVEADRLWQRGVRGAGHAVAVLDTGVDTGHPFLADRIVAEACFSSTTKHGNGLCPAEGEDVQFGEGAGVHCDVDPDDCAHGTHVAGIAAGEDTRSGVAPGADVMAVQVFHQIAGCSGSECLGASTSDLMAAMSWVYEQRDEHELAAVNLSLGGGAYGSACDSHPLAPVIGNLRSVGIATVAASGNNGYVDRISAPACISDAVSVGASTKGGAIATYSNANEHLLDLLAPGSAISSSVPGGGFAGLSGTSMAAPHVAGAWALLQDATDDRRSVDVILGVLADTGHLITDHIYEDGDNPAYPEIRIDAASFLLSREAGDPAPGVVEGTVTSAEDGAPVNDASVTVVEAGATVGTATTDGAGAYAVEVPEGTYEVSASASGFEDASATGVEVGEGETVTVDLALEPVAADDPEPATLRGTVTDADSGGALEGVEVSLDGVGSVLTGGEGRYLFEQLEAGSYALSAHRDGYVAEAVDVEVGEGETVTVDLALEPEPTQTFSDVPPDHKFYTEITWLADEGIAGGYPDGTFKPTRAVSRQAMARFLHRTAGSPSGPFPDPGFSDVPPDHQFYTEIAWMADEGIAGGFPDGTFGPTRPVSRQAMAAFLHRTAGGPSGPFPDPGFSDVPRNHKFYTEIAWMADAGITSGYPDGTFRPTIDVSRQATAAFLYNTGR